MFRTPLCSGTWNPALHKLCWIGGVALALVHLGTACQHGLTQEHSTHHRTAEARRVPIRFDVPEGTEAYNGRQPVTFGIPFPKGDLVKTDSLRVVDAAGREMPAQFQVTATWGPQPPESEQVRWLLVDLVAEITNGKAPAIFLEFGKDLTLEPPASPLTAVKEGETVRVNTGVREFVFDRSGGSLGWFVLTADANRECASNGANANVKIQLEQNGPVRAVVKMTGDYVAPNGDLIGEWITRVRLYANCPLVRVYHTIVWLTDHHTRLGGLRFVNSERIAVGRARVGLDGEVVTPKAESLHLRQVDWNRVEGAAAGRQLDGWVEVSSPQERVTAILRWPWQQFPTGIRVRDGRIELGLIDPGKPLSLAAKDVIVPPMDFEELQQRYGTHSVHVPGAKDDKTAVVTPRGVSKTYEFVLWFDKPGDEVPAPFKNTLVQHPIYAFADPAFATLANEPCEVSPPDVKRFPHVEEALDACFDWLTLERARDGDYGLWNFGDVQHGWGGRGYTQYRYWSNHGKGLQIVPWLLYLRSGRRKYLEFAERNARHCMDVDTCHVRGWEQGTDGRRRGAVYHYSCIHWSHGPQVATFYLDSEYMPMCYYLTGYERARDVSLTRVEALRRYDYPDLKKDWWKEGKIASRGQYSVLRDLAILYRVSWDSRLRDLTAKYLDYVVGAQQPTGWFPGITSPFYIDHALNHALRTFPHTGAEQALLKWIAFHGDADKAGFAMRRSGACCLWSQVAASRISGERRYLDAAIRTARAQALAVDTGSSIFRGSLPLEANRTGPLMRGWITTVAAASARKELPTGLAPLMCFHGKLPLTTQQIQANWRGRHVALVLEEQDGALSLDLFFNLHNFNTLEKRSVKVRVYGPQDKLCHEETCEIQATYQQQFGKPYCTVRLPADGKQGVYAFEIFTQQMAAPLHAHASTGKIVHFLPPGLRSFVSGAFVAGGATVFEPEPGAEVVVDYPGLPPLPNAGMTVLGPDGRIRARTRILSAGKDGSPDKAEPIRFTAKAEQPGLHSLVLGYWRHNGVQRIRGARPWFAASKHEWFDPEGHAMPDTSRFLVPDPVAVDLDTATPGK